MTVYRRLRSTLKIISLCFCGGVDDCFVCSLFIRAVSIDYVFFVKFIINNLSYK